jgi:hypothetical protein
MAEMDDVLAELRHRIMRPFESAPPNPARPPHQETNEKGATTQSLSAEYQRHGSAAVALRRLAHPGRDGGVVVEDDPVSEPINPKRGGGVVVGDDPISQLFRRLSIDMPELMEEVVAFIERRAAELNGDDGAAPTESAAPAALVPATPTSQDDAADTTAITLLFDTRVLARIDADAERTGISRTAWLHVAADERLEGRR